MVSVARLVSTAAVAGGLLAGSVALGAGVASAAPAPSKVVPASCGQTVSAMPGDTVRVKPKIGQTEDYVIGGSPGTTRIPSTMERPSCEVDVKVKPGAGARLRAGRAGLRPRVRPGLRARIRPGLRAGGTDGGGARPAAPGAAPAPAAAPLAAAPAPAARAAAPAAIAPAPAAGRSATSSSRGSGAAASSVTDGLAPGAALPAVPSLPFGAAMAPAAPMAPVPPAAPDAQVLPTRNTATVAPADDSHGLGVPILIALIAGTGVAAFVVRMLVLRRRSEPAHAVPQHDGPFADDGSFADDPFAHDALDPAEETSIVDPAEARTVVGSRA